MISKLGFGLVIGAAALTFMWIGTGLDIFYKTTIVVLLWILVGKSFDV